MAQPDLWSSAVASGDPVQLSKLILESSTRSDLPVALLRCCVTLLEEDLALSDEDGLLVSCPSVSSPPSSGPDAFAVALKDHCDGEGWFSSTKELQMASLEYCATCRSVATLTLRVDDDVPRSLLASTDARISNRKRLRSTQVPRLSALHVLWNMSTAVELRRSIHALTNVTRMSFGPDFDDNLIGVLWPTSLQHLTFGDGFDEPIEAVAWPNSVRVLGFGKWFNQPVEGVNWPQSLQRLTFGEDFNQPIDRVTWPNSMRRLVFGDDFNQPVERVVWPNSLEELSFGSTDKAMLSPSGVEVFSAFNHPISGARWPASLRRLTLGSNFSCSCQGLGDWMPNLEEFVLLLEDPSDYLVLLGGILWPNSLRKLKVYDYAEMEGVVIPPKVEVLRCGLWLE